MHRWWVLVFLFGFYKAESAKYYIYLKDKPGMELDAFEYFHQRTLLRRQKCHVPLVQFSDLPVNPSYVDEIEVLVDSITVVSRWLNMVCVYTQNVASVANLPFVRYVAKPAAIETQVSEITVGDRSLAYDYNLGAMQLKRMKGAYFQDKGLNGSSVSVAVFDVGFAGANEHPAFHGLNIGATWDFVRNDDHPYRGGKHGTSVLACIGGVDIVAGWPLGLAPDARFLLARTERNSIERSTEEEYWLAAAEWADKMGVDIINSSLGYTAQRYKRQEMDGKTALVSRAAQIAFSKGILVVSAAGNEGSSSWKYVSAPADADSILSIGAIDPTTDVKIGFSSVGPNVNYTMKPNLCAYGEARTANGHNEDYHVVSGTSFSSPLVAGFVACVIQAFPTLNHRAISKKVQHSGHLYPYFDYAHGFGVPQAHKIGLEKETQTATPLGIDLVGSSPNRSLVLHIDEEHFHYLSKEDLAKKNLYFHVKNASGQIIYYAVKRPDDFSVFMMKLKKVPGAREISVHFEGYTLSQSILP